MSSLSGKTKCVHHIDGNHFNDAPENLLEMTVSEHMSLHKLGNTYMRGKHFSHSEDTKERMRKAHLGKTLSEETKKKIGQASLGRHFNMSEEAKEKISKAATAQWERWRLKNV